MLRSSDLAPFTARVVDVELFQLLLPRPHGFQCGHLGRHEDQNTPTGTLIGTPFGCRGTMTTVAKPVRLTSKEVARADAGITIIVRPQARGGFQVMAVRVEGLSGTPLGRTFTEVVETKGDIAKAAKEVARWVSKMGFPSKMADSARHR